MSILAPLVCISGCCWCGERVDHLQRRGGRFGPPPAPFEPFAIRAFPCGHEVEGDAVEVDGGYRFTLWPPGGQAPHMHPSATA